MWVDLISMAAVGVLAACLLFIIRHALKRGRRSLPRWILPAAVGASMIGYSIWNEYSWFDRITSSLPSTVAIVGQGERSAFWAPWTYAVPVTVRFIALDSRVRVQSEQSPGLVLTELLLVERWQPTRRVPVAFDCHQARRADLVGDAQIKPDGTLKGTQWQAMEPDSPMMRVVCQSTHPE
jgi:hypothetical protein